MLVLISKRFIARTYVNAPSYYWFAKIREVALEVQQTVDEPNFVELSAPETEATVVTQSTIATIKVGSVYEDFNSGLIMSILAALLVLLIQMFIELPRGVDFTGASKSAVLIFSVIFVA